ncbi:arylamine N-acetyltransferase [Streptomyces sp. NPDC004327]|uniref:arylamine N-acetyltransferase family protein n=1 Tax=unclassified Streptomyces TaxID=2593676 RepID=UPI0036A53ED4
MASYEGDWRMWGAEELDLDAYLARIGHSGEVAADLATLRALHRAHVAAIPFENLDVALGRRISLEPKSLQAKLVGRRRGGYCYEQNSLFAAVLERIGFQVSGRGARVRAGDEIRPITHAVLVVTVEGRPWLADTGFGYQGIIEPVPLADGSRAEQDGWTFGIGVDASGVHALRSLRPEGWTQLYTFAPQPLYPVDFELMNHYSSSHPRSRFVGQIVAQQPGPEAGRSLLRDTLTVVRPDGTSEERKVGPEELAATLTEVFGIELDDEEAAGLLRVHPVEV